MTIPQAIGFVMFTLVTGWFIFILLVTRRSREEKTAEAILARDREWREPKRCDVCGVPLPEHSVLGTCSPICFALDDGDQGQEN